jgi:CRISPR/Cas system-associated endoribonuclease Cas2
VSDVVEERLYIVTYDIADDRRWRRVFKLMKGYGHWQLSVFQCRLTGRRRAELEPPAIPVVRRPRARAAKRIIFQGRGTNGFTDVSPAKRLKSRSADHSSRTPCC